MMAVRGSRVWEFPEDRNEEELGLSHLSAPYFKRYRQVTYLGQSHRCWPNQLTLEEAPVRKEPVRDESAPKSCHSPQDNLSALLA